VATLVRRHQAVGKDKISTEGADYLTDAKAQLALLNDQRRQVVVSSSVHVVKSAGGHSPFFHTLRRHVRYTQVLTPLHLTLELDSGAGPLLETFTASYTEPGQSFSVLGSLHVFENSVAFHGTSAVLGTSMWKVELQKINKLRHIAVMVRTRLGIPKTARCTLQGRLARSTGQRITSQPFLHPFSAGVGTHMHGDAGEPQDGNEAAAYPLARHGV
jgi:hypothetical protein